MYVCMYVCMYICMYVYMYVLCLYVCTGMYVCCLILPSPNLSYGIVLHICTIAITNCTNRELRLTNGSSSNGARVEMCIQGEWGTIADYGWSRREARVVCRQLGYEPGCE